MSSFKRTAVLVAERDGDWRDWVDALRAEADDVAVVVEREGESPAELATRVREQVAELRGELVSGALVGGDRWDPATLTARSLMIRAIVSQMVANGVGRMYLDSGSKLGRGRHAMQALAFVVEDQIGDSGVEVVTTTGARRVAHAA